MKHRFTLSGFEDQTLEIQTSVLGGARLLINGQPAPRGAKHGEMLLRRSDGAVEIARWRAVLKGWDTPQLVIGGKALTIVAPLRWYEWLWSALPMLLVFSGGIFGGMAGAIAVSLNAYIFRAPMPAALRYLLTATISLSALLLYGSLASLALAALDLR
jgi:hypothetical protein